MAQFSFERGVYTFSEGDGSGQQIFVDIVDKDIQIPDHVSIAINATIEPSSNATQGKQSLTPLHHHYIIITTFIGYLCTDVDYNIAQLLLIFRNTTRFLELDIGLGILQDELVEGHEVINLRLNEPVISGLVHEGGAILAPNGHQRTTVIIEEDDGKPAFVYTNIRVCLRVTLATSEMCMYASKHF